MADHIPFVYTPKDRQYVQRNYPDSAVLRLSLDSLDRTLSALPQGTSVWLDSGIDGFGDLAGAADSWRRFAKKFPAADAIGDPTFQAKPLRSTTKSFVVGVLNECLNKAPSVQWLSVPQLPMVNGASRNKINRQLAQVTREWKQDSNFRGKLILPVILTHQKQVNLKTLRRPNLDLASSCYNDADADGVWVVESTLSDQDGSNTFEQTRFPGLVKFHEELTELLPKDSIAIAGPYWGMNLVLWARGLVKYPAIGLGNAYQYRLRGGVLKSGKTRVAIPPLRRCVVASPQFAIWLKRVMEEMPRESDAYPGMASLFRDYNRIATNPDQARAQIAGFYKEWFDKIAAVPPPGRALALFQDLSSAYVFGKGLPALPRDEGSARRPERVAQQYMLSCL